MSAAQVLAGREHELALFDERLLAVSDRGSTLVVRGDPGMGKSALLQAARRSAVDHGLATLVTAGFQSEAHIAFAGLHRLRYRPPSVCTRQPRRTSS